MREILFRGKRIDNGEWVEGSLIETTAVSLKTLIVDSACYTFDKIGNDGYAVFDWLNCYEVDPATVGQYTGLTDKNGKKIFEGDVVDRATERSGQKSSHRTGVVVFKRYGFVFEPIGNRGHGMWICGEFEVIGNIHDKEET